MDFTREPIIETVITPREGYKLTLRGSKTTGAEEFIVDAVEVVSFGRSLFYRCLERPKCFLLPVSDYEVMETKETRVVLKNATIEKSIKIAGGRKKPERDEEEKPQQQQQPREPRGEPREGQQSREGRGGRRQMRRNKKGPSDAPASDAPAQQQTSAPEGEIKPAVFRPLIPPPAQLISEKFRKVDDQHILVPIDQLPPPRAAVVEEEVKVDVGHSDPTFPGFVTESLPHNGEGE